MVTFDRAGNRTSNYLVAEQVVKQVAGQVVGQTAENKEVGRYG